MPPTSRAKISTVPSYSVFCSAALASGLLTPDQLERVLIAAYPDAVPAALDDEPIAAQAVALGLLNRWQAEQLRAGRTKFSLGQYQILDSIGQGGMGHVFKAEHSMLGRIEAVKVLPKSKSTPEAIASFRREIRAQAQLDHPNLVRLSYAGQEGSTYFFVTEYVPGVDLRRLVRKNGRLTMQQAATIIAQAAHGLDHAHRSGLVHRDIKPGNLLVTPEGRTKVADLGLAGYLREEEAGLDDPRAGRIVGTADYLAPETIRNPGEVSPASDIYSLGCTLYYAVTGKVPFPGGSTRDKLRRQCEEVPLTPQRLNPELDDAFVEVLAAMMEKDPAQRIASAEEVIRRLAPWTLQSVPIAVQDDRSFVPQGGAAGGLALSDEGRSSGSQPHFLEAVRLQRDTPGNHSQSTVPVPPPLHETLPLDPFDWAEELRLRFGQFRSRLWHTLRRLRSLRVPRELLSQLFVPLLLVVAILITVGVLYTVLSGRG